MAVIRDGGRHDRTQEVAGSSPPSSIKVDGVDVPVKDEEVVPCVVELSSGGPVLTARA